MADTFNLRFDISPQAMVIRAALEDYAEQPQVRGVSVQAWPHFNGRERGICLEVSKYTAGPWLLVSFGEERGSDRIFVQHVVTGRVMMNGPERRDFTEDSYQTRASFPYMQILPAVEHIFGLIAAWRDGEV